MNRPEIPGDVQRFLLTGAVTVPHVEAILQLRGGGPAVSWDAKRLAARLYVQPSQGAALLSDLCAMGIAKRAGDEPDVYRYAPTSTEFAQLLDRLSEAYSNHLVAVTHMIHSARERTAHLFADAFRFRKDP